MFSLGHRVCKHEVASTGSTVTFDNYADHTS